MTLTSDGKLFVFAVFQADGCECEFLDSLHENQESADLRIEEIRKDPYAYAHKPELVTCQMLEVKANTSVNA